MASNLLDDIQQQALDPEIPLADTLRKLVALGGQAGSTELREWASRELRGYAGSGIDLPDYRKPGAVMMLNAMKGNYQITGQQISPRYLPEAVREFIDEEVGPTSRGNRGHVPAGARRGRLPQAHTSPLARLDGDDERRDR